MSSVTWGRRNRASLSGFGINTVDLRNPWVLICWAAFLPGFGHVRIGKHIVAWILIGWELVVNNMSHLNQAITYTFGGHFDLAMQVLDKRIIFLYIPVYVFSMCNVYRTCVELNKQYVMVDREDVKLDKPFHIDPFEVNFLDKRSPINTVLWSLFIPGLGHLLSYRVVPGFFNLVWWIVVMYYSHGLESVWFACHGAFGQSIHVLNPQWALFLPSMYGFAAYDAYCSTVELNKLFEKEQSKFLRINYQSPHFPMYLGVKT